MLQALKKLLQSFRAAQDQLATAKASGEIEAAGQELQVVASQLIELVHRLTMRSDQVDAILGEKSTDLHVIEAPLRASLESLLGVRERLKQIEAEKAALQALKSEEEQKAASWATQAKEAASTAQMEGGRAEALMKQAGKAAEEKREEEKAAERARIEAEEKARIEAEQAAERARIEAEEKARIEAEKAAERARIEAEEKARIEAEQAAERARIEAEEKARIEAEKAAERARIEAEEKARIEAEKAAERAQIEAEEQARIESEKAAEAARIEAEAQSVMKSMKSDTSTMDLQGKNGVEDQPKEQAPEALATNPSLPKTGPTSPCKQQKAAQDPTLTSQVAEVQRLFVKSDACPKVSGEYRRSESDWQGRQAFKKHNDEIFLVWSPREAGHWTFTRDPNAEEVLARSLQVSLTTTPEELMCRSWTMAPWRSHGSKMVVHIQRA
ncbi:unnamed protein product [Cladocopium goreaui]|uniref:Ras-related protein Rab-6A n=1 Tax=Cladocopium goreaui TaxID=2562237 RepID=A0A9P1CFU8_9DINO|nr:unnamed protein product [Cladocopium goreaui]